MDDYTPREITEEEISIETSDGKSIDAFDKEVVEELIVEELIEQGFSEDDVEDLSEIGAEMLLNENHLKKIKDLQTTSPLRMVRLLPTYRHLKSPRSIMKKLMKQRLKENQVRAKRLLLVND